MPPKSRGASDRNMTEGRLNIRELHETDNTTRENPDVEMRDDHDAQDATLFDTFGSPQTPPNSSFAHALSPIAPSFMPRFQRASRQTAHSNSGVVQLDGLRNRQQNGSEETTWGQQSGFLSNHDSFSVRGPVYAYGQQSFVGNHNFAPLSTSGYTNTLGFDNTLSFDNQSGFSLPDYYEPMSCRGGPHPGTPSEVSVESHSLQTCGTQHHPTFFTSVFSSSSATSATSVSNRGARSTFQSGGAYVNTHSNHGVLHRPQEPLFVHPNRFAPLSRTPQLSRSGSDPSIYQTFHSSSFDMHPQPVAASYHQHFGAPGTDLRPNHPSDHRYQSVLSHPTNHIQIGSANSTLSPRGSKRRFAAGPDTSVSHSTAASEQTLSQSGVSLFGSPPPSRQVRNNPRTRPSSNASDDTSATGQLSPEIGHHVLLGVPGQLTNSRESHIPSWAANTHDTEWDSEELDDTEGQNSGRPRVDSTSSDMSLALRQRKNPESTEPFSGLFDQLRKTANTHPSAVLLYKIETSKSGSEVWPDIRDDTKVPARWVPLQINPAQSSKQPTLAYSPPQAKKLSSSQQETSRASPLCAPVNGKGWPKGEVPAEIYGLIMEYLSRDDIKAMRLVSKEFEKFTSFTMFKAVVVPFNTEIYGMLGSTESQEPTNKDKGKGKMTDKSGLVWNNAKEDDLYTGHGMEVFKGFGPHILKYGMSFEVDEGALARLPYKSTREGHKSYWGSYDWPFEGYKRFDRVAGLENAADETPLMKTAFSFLSKVKELALSIDNGLGWLNGPDVSLRTRILHHPPAVFGATHEIPDRKTQAQDKFWKHLEHSHGGGGADSLKYAALFRQDTASSSSELNQYTAQAFETRALGLTDPSYVDIDVVAVASTTESSLTRSLSVMDTTAMADIYDEFEGIRDYPDHIPQQGIIFTTAAQSNAERISGLSIIPGRLSKSQREWLLETEWAQRAFLSSYMVAVMDNPSTFQNVHWLNFARLSSKYIMSLCRHDFWDALPALKTVNIQIIADWRSVHKDPAGFVETQYIDPSSALGYFQKLLKEMVVMRSNINDLQIGWAGGGEHAEGVHARNKHILPAPILPEEWLESQMTDNQLLSSGMVRFPYVEKLTLTNCWLTPYALLSLARGAAHLEKLTLDSVSLTAVPRQGAGNHHHIFHQAQALGLAQPNNPGAPPPPQPPGAAGLTQTLNTLNQAMTNLQALLATNPAPPIPAAPVATATQPAPLREGSWPLVIAKMFRNQLTPLPTDATTPLAACTAPGPQDARILTCGPIEVEFISCGYARIASARIDQSAVEPPTPIQRDAFFAKRYATLNPYMMVSKDPLLGEIVQYMPEHEEDVLRGVWGLTIGWGEGDEAERKKQAAEFDGLLPGGTGRFSGVVRREGKEETSGEPA